MLLGMGVCTCMNVCSYGYVRGYVDLSGCMDGWMDACMHGCLNVANVRLALCVHVVVSCYYCLLFDAKFLSHKLGKL